MKIMESVGNMATSCLETACQFTIGQFFIRMLDRGMGIIEKTARWSLPNHEIDFEENGKSFKSVELVRPLPWILFLPSLVILRGFRFTWNVGAFVIGYSEIHPSDIVKTFQKMRRHLRTIRVNSVKQQRKIKPQNAREQNLGINETKRSLLQSIQLTLSTLSCFDASKMKSSPPPMRIRVPMNYGPTSTPDDKSTIESTIVTQQCEAKRKYSEVSSDDSASNEESEGDEMSFNTKLSHFASLNSSNDPDFDLTNCTGETDDINEEELYENEIKNNKTEIDKLLEETRHILIDDYKITNPEMSEEEILAVVDARLKLTEQKKKTRNGNGNCMKKDSDDLQDYYSPCKSIEDVDTKFFSPISSKSSSPQRDITADDVLIVDESNIKEPDASQSSIPIVNDVEESHAEENNKHEIEKKDNEKNNKHSDLSGIKGKQQRESFKTKRSTYVNRKKKL